MKKLLSSKNIILISSILSSVAIIVCCIFLPNKVPVHISESNVVDVMGSPWYLAILCLITIAIPIICNIYMVKTKKENASIYICEYVFTFFIIYISWILLYMASVNLNYGDILVIPYYLITGIPLAMVMISFGAFSQNIKPNAWVGVKNIYTLNNSNVWIATHIRAKYYALLSGLIFIGTLIIIYFTQILFLFFIGLFVSIVIMIVPPSIFSKKFTQKLNNIKNI